MPNIDDLKKVAFGLLSFLIIWLGGQGFQTYLDNEKRKAVEYAIKVEDDAKSDYVSPHQNELMQQMVKLTEQMTTLASDLNDLKYNIQELQQWRNQGGRLTKEQFDTYYKDEFMPLERRVRNLELKN